MSGDEEDFSLQLSDPDDERQHVMDNFLDGHFLEGRSTASPVPSSAANDEDTLVGEPYQTIQGTHKNSVLYACGKIHVKLNVFTNLLLYPISYGIISIYPNIEMLRGKMFLHRKYCILYPIF